MTWVPSKRCGLASAFQLSKKKTIARSFQPFTRLKLGPNSLLPILFLFFSSNISIYRFIKHIVESVHFDLVYVNMVMINFNNPHLTNWFCGLMYDSTTIFKIVSESSPKFIGPPTIRFPISDHPLFIHMIFKMVSEWISFLTTSEFC